MKDEKHVKTWMGLLIALPALTLTTEGVAQTFGRHPSHGGPGVNYLYNTSEGTWKSKAGIAYVHSFYPATHYSDLGITCNQPQPFDKDAAIKYADDVLAPGQLDSDHTSPDADCHLLADLDNDLLISDESPQPTAASFFENRGKGKQGANQAPPFYQFWFDDNWLARYMAIAYGKPLPTGLHDNGYRIRWRALAGDNTGWTNYPPDEHLDRRAINGLAFANAGDHANAFGEWSHIQAYIAEPSWNATTRRYDYIRVHETYHLGLWLILTERLIADGNLNAATRAWLVQHAVSLRSWLLTTQEVKTDGTRIGWRSDYKRDDSLINTETTALSALALAAETFRAYEAGYSPLGKCPTCGFTLDTDRHVLSATVAGSSAGHMVFGPYATLAPGTHTVDFDVRLPSGCGASCGSSLVTVDVYDGTTIVASTVLTGSSFSGSDWLRQRLSFTVSNPSAPYEFRAWFHDMADVDIAAVRLN